MQSALCKMCGLRSDFVKAHIVPRSFYPERGRSKDALIFMSSRTNDRIRRSRIGIYDNQLLCAECERHFDPFDNYAAKLLIDGMSAFRAVNHDGKPLAYQVRCSACLCCGVRL